mmetsp:Transcript_59889/g.126773  ORF Transcript_59889/g.126773 Transcript_59889/m.126773 type:complete len:254 (+) Transcript_59889:986-1747(+)
MLHRGSKRRAAWGTTSVGACVEVMAGTSTRTTVVGPQQGPGTLAPADTTTQASSRAPSAPGGKHLSCRIGGAPEVELRRRTTTIFHEDVSQQTLSSPWVSGYASETAELTELVNAFLLLLLVFCESDSSRSSNSDGNGTLFGCQQLPWHLFCHEHPFVFIGSRTSVSFPPSLVPPCSADKACATSLSLFVLLSMGKDLGRRLRGAGAPMLVLSALVFLFTQSNQRARLIDQGSGFTKTGPAPKLVSTLCYMID